ncbi:hypothetical protein J2Z37_003247 [Ammoniphilus resinae]|uniref:Uncharacterized protein n=1 Tax=Ammoniphilus resinae TaxID=861532 RepID=A0ABS4GSM7_9BACL|nr:hypothetical protein [Ammoniphilus resinae]
MKSIEMADLLTFHQKIVKLGLKKAEGSWTEKEIETWISNHRIR